MSTGFIAKKTITIHAPVSVVWKGLTDPAQVKKYFFGSNLHTSWKKGTPIRFTGEWEGKSYEDKGTVLKYEDQKVLQYDYWSSMSDKPDAPENYQLITYRVKPKGDSTVVTIMQNNIKTLESKEHSAKNWGMVLKSLKDLIEK